MEQGIIDDGTLHKIGHVLKVNTVIQGEVIDIKRKFPKYRKVIGETTATVKYSIFSTTQGKLLWEATCSRVEKNAHSEQLIPPAIDAIEIAFDEIIDNLPFDPAHLVEENTKAELK